MNNSNEESPLEVESVHVSSPVEQEMFPMTGQLAESVNSGSVGDEGLGGEFNISITTLTMGLKTVVCKVRSNSTVGEVKQLLQTVDDKHHPPERQRLIYDKRELKDDDVTLGELTPPVQEGSRFSMALELKVDAVAEEWTLQISHYHDGIREIKIDPSLLILDLIESLQSTEEEDEDDKWEGGRLRIGDHIIDDEDTPIRDIPEITNGSLLLYEATPIEGLTGCIDDLGDINARIPLETEASDMNLRVDDIINPIIHQQAEQQASSSHTTQPVPLWFEVRYYCSTQPNFQSVVIKANSTETISELKIKIEAAFMQEQGRAAPADRQKLLCHAQVRSDSDHLSSYNLGSRGTSEDEPAIIQLYLRELNHNASNASLEERETAGSSEDSHPRRETLSSPGALSSAGGCSKLKKAQQVLFIIFILALGMIMLASGAVMLLNPTPNNGYCYSTISSVLDSTCIFKGDDAVWKPSMEKIAFLSSPTAKPCLDCAYVNPGDLDRSIVSHELSFAAALDVCSKAVDTPSGGLLFTSLSLPMVTQIISPHLCSSSWDVQTIWIDAELSDPSASTYTTSGGETLFISNDMWDDPEHKSFGLGTYLQLDLVTCKVKAVDRFTTGSVLCQYKPFEKRLVSGTSCAAASETSNVTVSPASCPDYCREWCYSQQVSGFNRDQFGPQCCSSEELSDKCTCRASATASLVETPNAGISAKVQEPSYLSPSTISSTHYIRDGVVFFYYKNTVVVSTSDSADFPATRVSWTTLEDCAQQCVDSPTCRTFSYQPVTRYCELWPLFMEDLPPLVDAEVEGFDVYSSSVAKFSSTCSVATADSYVDRESCMLSTWNMLQTSLSCHIEGDINCDPGHVAETPSVFAVAFITGGGLLLYFFVACCAWDILDHLRKQEGRL